MGERAVVDVDGQKVELPTIDDFDLDETSILYELSGLTADQVDDSTALHPGVLKTLVHVGLRRAGVSDEEIAAKTGKVKLTAVLQALADLAGEEEADAVPPAPSENEQPSEPGSGVASSTSSETPPDGNGRSGTGIPASEHWESRPIPLEVSHPAR